MKRLIFPAVFLFLALFRPVSAADGIEFALDVYQRPDTGTAVQLMTDTTVVTVGSSSSGFLLTFSLDVEADAVDSTGASFVVHVVTLGPPANTYSRRVRAEWGLPARFDDIVGKNGTRYSLLVTPQQRVDVDTAICPFDYRTEGLYKTQPSANMDFYYVPGSYADFYWATAKGLLETDFRLFKNGFSLNLPGKYLVFLCPCPITSVIWDKRFGQMVDPTKSTAFALYAKDQVSIDPFIVDHCGLLRQYGYAPPFLSEGWANYGSFAIYDMKKLADAGEVPPLDSLLDTYSYLTADPVLSDRVSATFVRFLIDSYGIGEFKQLYQKANDLTLRADIADIYATTIDSLDAAWRYYVDTLTIRWPMLGNEVQKAEALSNYGRMEDYSRDMLRISPGHIDSLFALSVLKRALFYQGDYYDAEEVAKEHLNLDKSDPSVWLSLAAYQMMNGLYDQARQSLLNGHAVDTTDQMISFNLALNYLYTGDTTRAESLLVEVVNNSGGNGPQGESRIYLGELVRRHRNKTDSARAMTYYSEALGAYQQALQTNQTNPSLYMWMGIAALGFGDTDNAFNSLEMAQFLETRPFYIGMINLWLGKLSDVRGDHTAATDYYGAVLAGASADYHQREARRLIEHPYSQ